MMRPMPDKVVAMVVHAGLRQEVLSADLRPLLSLYRVSIWPKPARSQAATSKSKSSAPVLPPVSSMSRATVTATPSPAATFVPLI